MLARRNLLLSLLAAPFAFLSPKKADAKALLKGCNIIAAASCDEPLKLVTVGVRVEPGDFSVVGGGERILSELRDLILTSGKPLIDDEHRISMHFLQADGKPWGRGDATIPPSQVFEKGHWSLLRTAMYMARSHGTPTTWEPYATLKYIGVSFFVTESYRAPGFQKLSRAMA